MASAAFHIRDLNNRTQTAKSEAAFVKDILIPKILQKNLMFFSYSLFKCRIYCRPRAILEPDEVKEVTL